MDNFDTQPWYHGTQQELSVIRAGSSITQDRSIAKVFSHRPTLVSFGLHLKHDGCAVGFLHLVDEEIGQEDVYRHPRQANQGGWEWVTTRDLQVRLLEVAGQTYP